MSPSHRSETHNGTDDDRPAAKTPEKPVRVLVVDDDSSVVEAMAALLALFGYDTERCFSGAVAIAAVARQPPRVVLLDVSMPGMDGYETAVHLRGQAPSSAQMLLVAMSGYDEAEDEAAARRAGFDRYLTKPVGHAALAEVLAAVQ